ncbi:hypothetical protein [Plasticicumulans sp.]|nr:hypothetical protein [Plasticicumulans sp.]MBS0602755.1 hypothetical protein [Pseudomonadota bacterium]HNG49144.1 hypothetical protein [Plasticicumulans sp.]HNM41972.1 hypothetical protein [Plasticicumulans sp.]
MRNRECNIRVADVMLANVRQPSFPAVNNGGPDSPPPQEAACQKIEHRRR